MFAIFFTGTIAFFRHEVTFWMQPELHRTTAVGHEEAAKVAIERLEAIAPQAREWGVVLPSERNPTLRISWDDAGADPDNPASAPADRLLRDRAEKQAEITNARGGRPRDPGLLLDPATGDVLTPRDTAGGEFLYRFHYRLHGLPNELGRWIIGLATFAMFIAIISGIITHKKIFTDFFTFRAGKGQRSWLDGHNAMAVLSLPFHLMITFSGLLLLGSTLLPWSGGGGHGHGGHGRAGNDEIVAASGTAPEQDRIASDRIIAEGQSIWGAPAGRMIFHRVNGVTQTVELTSQKNDDLTLRPGGGPGRTITFDAKNAEVVERTDTEAENAIAATDRTMVALHLGRFAPWQFRWLLFVAGVAGTLMIATGLVLWSVKRKEKRRGAPGTVGHRLVDSLNIAAITGLPLATAAYFWASRIISAASPDRANLEISIFFAVWLGSFIHALFRPDGKAWLEQLIASGLGFASLAVLNPLSGGMDLVTATSRGNWIVAGFDLTVLVTGAVFLLAANLLAARATRNSSAQPRPSNTAAATELAREAP
ncbi:PepSY-associated TM helix domain-containing protein [Croceicoccus gelatinilyticus]|uniref:PepSY-associated TM helix domain-containing protein n=1 Tax=Croceicoccus gelatinilyticus TaxID=2835536 RepID=UPI001BCCE8BB|nr:PepSY-associated TM helix domain-containing protein [Croceicoccus gelatinilyticus]MBS7668703.1 PepSY domain-containing protein [Croceicoccus gelatinilyticus]